MYCPGVSKADTEDYVIVLQLLYGHHYLIEYSSLRL